MVNHYKVHVILQGIEHQIQENNLHHSLLIFMKSGKRSLIHSKLFTGTFGDIAQPYESFTSQYLRYDDSLFLSQFFMYLLLAFPCR